MVISCQNRLCIYQNNDNNKCILTDISIDEIGICNEYALIEISKEELKKRKHQELKLIKYD